MYIAPFDMLEMFAIDKKLNLYDAGLAYKSLHLEIV